MGWFRGLGPRVLCRRRKSCSCSLFDAVSEYSKNGCLRFSIHSPSITSDPQTTATPSHSSLSSQLPPTLNASPMSRPLRLVINPTRAQCRSHTTVARPPRFAPVQILPNASLETFRRDAFESAVPALLPRGAFADLAARKKWFVKSAEDEWVLNVEYLAWYGDSVVPLEILTREHGQERGEERFERVEMPLSVFLE